MTAILPARLNCDANGTPYSEAYGDIYHSADGGPGQARHVFLHGNDLPGRWQGQNRFVILETGFGSGLNFLTTWAAWRDDPRRCRRLHYLAVELHPFSADDLARLHQRWPEFEASSRRLCAAWPVLTSGCHRLEFESGGVLLTLLLGAADNLLRQLRAQVDAFYLDGFDPRKNPEMWSAELFHHLAHQAAPQATLSTWCVAGAVRAALQTAGFLVTRTAGFGRKRQMLTGHLAPSRGSARLACAIGDRRALVLGAGVAGCAVSERLAARGWNVTLVERHTQPAQEASGNLAGIVRPLVTRDDSLAARLSRACFLQARRSWRALADAGFAPRYRLDGVLQIARDTAHEEQMRPIPVAAGYPPDYLQFVEREVASSLLGAHSALGGWLFPCGGWASPGSLCRAWLAAGGERISLLAGVEAVDCRYEEGHWFLRDAFGRPIAAAPLLVLAGGAAQRDLFPELPITPVRGQVSHIPQGKMPDLRLAACCEGYLTPAVDGVHCLGASYAYDFELELREDEHAGNLLRLERILPGVRAGLDSVAMAGRVGFRAATPDRLPLVGALADPEALLPRDTRLCDIPRRPGLYGLLGLGSRGLVWATLAAEILVSRIESDPSPVEGDLLDAIDPARFLLRAHRRGMK